MKDKFLLKNFDFYSNETITHGDGAFLFTKKKKKYLDSTSGLTGTAILGWKNLDIENAIKDQLSKICLIDYKYFNDENREKLARLLITKANHNLDQFFMVGGSGGEACEAAMKMSFQYFQSIGKIKKKWFISRKQSYHGSGSDAISVGDRPNLFFYKSFFPSFRAKISEHNVYRQKKRNETVDEYEDRSVKELEIKILKIGPENICGFVAETIMGGLVGDVPPTKNYWKKIKKICTRYNIHLILDEVWCGTGTTGKTFCVDWDKISPDFIFMGKTLAAGYIPVSGFVTSKNIGDEIKKKQGSIQFSTTHQGHSLGVAAAYAVQKKINTNSFLKDVIKKGNYLRNTLNKELGDHDFFNNVRGRGLRNSLEYKCKSPHLFGINLTNHAKERHNLLISAKWHRVCFSPAINLEKKILEEILDKFISSFKFVSKNWSKKKIDSIKNRNYY